MSFLRSDLTRNFLLGFVLCAGVLIVGQGPEGMLSFIPQAVAGVR
ncbi:hypothetical protein [Qipengyuania sp. JC766]